MSITPASTEFELYQLDGSRRHVVCQGVPWRYRDFLCWRGMDDRLTYFPFDQVDHFEIGASEASPDQAKRRIAS